MAKVTNKVEEPVVEAAPVKQPRAKKTTKKGTVANCELLNVRKEASASADVEKLIKAGTTIEILDTEGDFYKIADGYVMKAFINC